MNYLILTLAFLLYSLYSYIGYKDSIRNSNSYYVYGISIVIITNLLWITLSKRLESVDSILLYAMVWDSLIAFAAISIPIFFFKLNLTQMSYFGILLIVTGLIILKLGLIR